MAEFVEGVDDGHWHLAGFCDVDAGIIYVGDPCYILPDKRDEDPGGLDYRDLIDNWPTVQKKSNDAFAEEELESHRIAAEGSGLAGEALGRFMDTIRRMIDNRTYTAHSEVYVVPHKLGHDGRGICVHSGDGDGTYPVFVKFRDMGDWGIRVSAMVICFYHEDYPSPIAEKDRVVLELDVV